MPLMQPPEIIAIDASTTFCDGGTAERGHPRVYLTMKDGKVDCPYCGRRFVLADGGTTRGAH